MWRPPVEATSLSLPLSYCITLLTFNGATFTTYQDYAAAYPTDNSLNCIASSSLGQGAGYLYFIDNQDLSGAISVSYTVSEAV